MELVKQLLLVIIGLNICRVRCEQLPHPLHFPAYGILAEPHGSLLEFQHEVHLPFHYRYVVHKDIWKNSCATLQRLNTKIDEFLVSTRDRIEQSIPQIGLLSRLSCVGGEENSVCRPKRQVFGMVAAVGALGLFSYNSHRISKIRDATRLLGLKVDTLHEIAKLEAMEIHQLHGTSDLIISKYHDIVSRLNKTAHEVDCSDQSIFHLMSFLSAWSNNDVNTFLRNIQHLLDGKVPVGFFRPAEMSSILNLHKNLKNTLFGQYPDLIPYLSDVVITDTDPTDLRVSGVVTIPIIYASPAPIYRVSVIPVLINGSYMLSKIPTDVSLLDGEFNEVNRLHPGCHERGDFVLCRKVSKRLEINRCLSDLMALNSSSHCHFSHVVDSCEVYKSTRFGLLISPMARSVTLVNKITTQGKDKRVRLTNSSIFLVCPSCAGVVIDNEYIELFDTFEVTRDFAINKDTEEPYVRWDDLIPTDITLPEAYGVDKNITFLLSQYERLNELSSGSTTPTYIYYIIGTLSILVLLSGVLIYILITYPRYHVISQQDTHPLPTHSST